MGVNAGHLSRIENGKRPPTEALALACDEAFPERRGWFTDWYTESRAWTEIPPGFRSWAELEDKAASLRDWYPGILTGLLQTEGYARALLATAPRVTAGTISARLSARMDRQRRVLMRDDPPSAWFIVDELALYRRVGSAEIMTEQMRHLSVVAAMPNVMIQVLPAVAHPANASGFVIADDSAWCEHLASGGVYGGETSPRFCCCSIACGESVTGSLSQWRYSRGCASYGQLAEVLLLGCQWRAVRRDRQQRRRRSRARHH